MTKTFYDHELNLWSFEGDKFVRHADAWEQLSCFKELSVSSGLGPTNDPKCPHCHNSFQNSEIEPCLYHCAACKHIYLSFRPQIRIGDVFRPWEGPILANEEGAVAYRDIDGRMCYGHKYKEAGLEFGSEGRLVFPMKYSDLLRDFFRLADSSPNCDFWVCTEHPELVIDHLSTYHKPPLECTDAVDKAYQVFKNHRSNLRLGVPVSTQEEADKLLDELRTVKELAPCLFIEYDPKEEIDFSSWFGLELDRDGSWRRESKFGGMTKIIDQLIIRAKGKTDFMDNLWRDGCDPEWGYLSKEDAIQPTNITYVENAIKQCADAGVACFDETGTTKVRERWTIS